MTRSSTASAAWCTTKCKDASTELHTPVQRIFIKGSRNVTDVLYIVKEVTIHNSSGTI
jgi:hypothetical protein